MAGEELPPVVAVIDGDDSGLLAMFERDIAEARAFAADLQAAIEEGLGGITVSGAQIHGQGIGAAGEVMGEQLAAGIEEGAARLDLRGELQSASLGAAEIGQGAGDELASGIVEGASAAGDQIVREIAAPLTDGMVEAGAEAGAAAGQAIDSSMIASTASVGRVLAQQISEQLRLGLDAAAQSTMGLLGQVNASGFAATLASSSAGAGFLAGLPGLLRAAGLAAGSALGEGVVEGSSGAGDIVATQIGAELRGGIPAGAEAAASRLTDAFVEASAGIGDAIASQVGQEMAPDIADAGERAGEALKEALIEGAAGAGDVLGAQIGAGVGDGVAPGADAGAAAIEQAMQSITPEVEAEGEAAGVRYVAGLQRGIGSVGVPLGGLPIEELLAAGQPSNPFVQDPSDPFRTVRQDVLDAEQAMARAAGQLAADEAGALSGARAFESELDAVFETIYRGGAGMSTQLAAAMTEAFQGIEADTAGFSQAELRIFQGFYGTLNELGDQAALDFAQRTRLVRQEAVSGADIMASGMSTIGLPMPGGGTGAAEPDGPRVSVPGLAVASESKAAAAGAEELAGAADTAAVAAGGLGAVMGGPLMFGLMGVAGFLPMLSGLFNSGSQAAAAYAQAQQQLQQAVSQDSDMVGVNTVATIANQLATSGAADTLAGYGISLSDATAAMAGVKSAQTEVNGTLQNQIDGLQGLIGEQEAQATSGNAVIDGEKQQLTQLQATQEAMRSLENDVVNAVAHQNELTQATLNAEQAADVFNVQVRAGVLALQQQAQSANVNAAALSAYEMTLTPGTQAYKNAVNDQTIALANNAIQAGINAQALNQSLAPQAQLSDEAVAAANAYQQAGAATSAYTNALTALYGQYGQTSAAEAAAGTAIDNLAGHITSGTNAVDLNTAAGRSNITAFQGAAAQAEAYAGKVYQTTGSTQQADQVMQDFAAKIDHAAAEAHLTTGQIQELNTELFGVPDIKDITIHLDKDPAEQQMSALSGFIQGEIDSLNAKPINLFIQDEVANANSAPPNLYGGGRALVRDEGGAVEQGVPYMIGLNRKPEVFVPGASGYITPLDMLAPAMAAPASFGAAGSGGGASGEPYAIVVPVYVDGNLVTTSSRTSSQWYKRRNGLTGFE